MHRAVSQGERQVFADLYGLFENVKRLAADERLTEEHWEGIAEVLSQLSVKHRTHSQWCGMLWDGMATAALDVLEKMHEAAVEKSQNVAL